ncbi:MAG TPA: peptidoglycan DD-metalloendopeptidase family protein [Puia sp.]|jgi:septal ring factor EnvC (AmiA/AmiB activator)|nr:peptidoglycan DD-metalloendopeptidase family protein [Puia sp.]
MRKPVFLLLIILGSINFAKSQSPTQSRSELEKERASIQKEIEQVKNSLDVTHKNRKQTLGQLALLQKRLRLREAAISNINQQLNFIQADMNNSWSEIAKLTNELITLRKQYAESVIYAYENRTNYDYLNFIFAAGNFNDAVKRVEYLKSYRTYREQRADNILKTQVLLQNKIDGLKKTRFEKDEALVKQNKERQVLEVEKKEKDQVVEQLQGQEKELKREMNAKQKQDQKLGNAIMAAIRRAREEAIREAKKKAAATATTNSTAVVPEKTESNKNVAGTSGAGETPSAVKPATKPAAETLFNTSADITLSGNFEKDKGHLPWPIASGTIAMRYGPHEYIKGIVHNNQGITIEAAANSSITSVFDGQVQNVFNVGDVTAVMIRHGKYFTTYSNLSAVSVTKGEMVKTGQIIGKLADIGQLEFIISDEKDRLFDPEKWLRK